MSEKPKYKVGDRVRIASHCLELDEEREDEGKEGVVQDDHHIPKIAFDDGDEYSVEECDLEIIPPQLTPETCEARAKEIYTAPPTEPNFGTELAAAALPTDAAERKKFPIYSGFMCYFPHAIAAVANLSYKGNQQHHPDKPLHWDMDKSQDELDALMRHMIDGDWEQVAWRAMANLERKLTGKCQYTNK